MLPCGSENRAVSAVFAAVEGVLLDSFVYGNASVFII